MLNKKECVAKIIEYYKDAPIKRWAAAYAGISEDTLSNWEKEDSEFADHLKLLKAEYFRKKLTKARGEWILERMFKNEFINSDDALVDLRGLVVVKNASD